MKHELASCQFVPTQAMRFGSPVMVSNHLAENRGANFSINTSYSPDSPCLGDRLSSSLSTDHPFSEYTEAVESSITVTSFGKDKVFELDPLKVFKCVILTNWDNILGPQVSKCWINPEGEKSWEKLVNYVNMHVLTGDVDESNHNSSRDRERKLLFLPEQKIMILANIFNISLKLSRARLHCLSLVFPLENPRQAIQVTNLYSFLYKSSVGLKDVLKESTISSRRLDIHIGDLIRKLDSTVFNLMNYSLDQVSYPLQYFGDGTNREDYEFLKRAYQGVLQCAGFSVITGHRRQWLIMEQMSLLISYIIPVTEKCVTICPTKEHTQFSNHIFLQTIVYDDDNEDKVVLQGVDDLKTYGNRFPLAIIDITKKTVKVTASLEAFSNKQMKEMSINKYGKFVHKIVTRMISFGKNTEFLTRLGAHALQEINCKADLFKNLFADESSLSTVKRMLKWDHHDCNIFIAWACRVDPELKKQLFMKDYIAANAEQSELFPVLGKPMSRA